MSAIGTAWWAPLLFKGGAIVIGFIVIVIIGAVQNYRGKRP